jgi:hypothetical protein
LAFAQRIDTDQTVAQAEQDLKPFLPQALWSRLWPDEVRLMVAEAAAGARDLAREIQRQQQVLAPEADDDEATPPSDGTERGAGPRPRQR